jgi:hypothetical protein
MAEMMEQARQQHAETLALITKALGGNIAKGKLDSVSKRQCRKALGVFAERRKMSKFDAFRIVRKEQGVQSWDSLTPEQAQRVIAWMMLPLPEPEASKPDVGPSVDHAVTAIEDSPFVRWQNRTYNGIPVKEAREPFYPLSDLIAEVRQRLRANKCSDQLPEIWVRGQIEDLGLAGPRWVKDGKYSADAVDWIFHRAHKRHAKELGAPAPWAGQ